MTDQATTGQASDRRTVTTFCRICEPSCGLVAHVEEGTLVKLTPDRDHPVTQGFACHKGLAMVDVHRDPDRLDHPAIRDADGSWTDVSWDDAMSTIATKLAAITAEHGPNAVASYTGNPTAFNALGQQHIGQFLATLGVRRRFNSGTQDCANKFVASEAVFGTSLVHPIPDLEHTDLCLVIGENPRASQASFFSIPNVLGTMRRAAGRGRGSCSSTRVASRHPTWASATRCRSDPTPTCGSSPRCSTRSMHSAVSINRRSTATAPTSTSSGPSSPTTRPTWSSR